MQDTPTDHLPASIQEISLLFTTDAEVKKLNKQYRDKDTATDVLSFSNIEGLETQSFETNLGDIVISIETAKRQAGDFGNCFEQEVLRLLIHGSLHLLGYYHENVSPAEVLRMQKEEQRLADKYQSLSASLFPGLTLAQCNKSR